MDNRPIGVFDSGMGGLTAVRELAALLPHEQLIYFGDTGRVPYGGRSRNTIIRYARQDVAFLRSFDLKAIVVACGTVSTTALPILQAEAAGFPIFGRGGSHCSAGGGRHPERQDRPHRHPGVHPHPVRIRPPSASCGRRHR